MLRVGIDLVWEDYVIIVNIKIQFNQVVIHQSIVPEFVVFYWK